MTEIEAHAHVQSRSVLALITRSLVSRNNSAGRRKELLKTWARVCSYGSLALCRLPSKVCRNADLQRIDRLGQEMAAVMERDPASAAKYADYNHWIPFNVCRVAALSLHRLPPQRILDIGCGPGYFLAAAKACGHEGYGIDAPVTILSEVEARVYSEMLAALSCDQRVSPLLIERYVPMGLRLYDLDLITAFWICFNRHRQLDEWGVAEWRFFVDDAVSYLGDGGMLHLELNSNPERYHELEWYDQETLDFFRSAGTVQGGVVRIAKEASAMGSKSAVGLETPRDRIRVCLLSDTVGQDAGTERQVVETAKRLHADRFDVHVVCLEDSPQLQSLKDICHIAVFPTASAKSLQGAWQALRFRGYIRQHGIQIVHAYMNKTASFAVTAALASRFLVVTSRLNTGYWYTPAMRTFFRMLNLRTDAIMANSEEAKRIAVETEGLDPKRVHVVYQGVDMTRFSVGRGDPSAGQRLGIPPSSRVIGIVANLRPVKDHALFLRAAKIVAAAVDDVAFLLAGRGELYQELSDLACELGLRDLVFFTQGEGDIMDYLARMSIGCLTSFSEGFSNAIMEYMAAALPVVAIDVGGNRDAILDGETGYLVQKRSPEALAAPLIKLLRDEELRARMGAKGFERCTANFEVGKTIGQLEEFYTSLIFGNSLIDG